MLMLGLMAGSQAQEVDSRWRLRVQDLKHQVKVDATIRFAAGAASESCMAGKWKRLIVEAKTVKDEGFFPLAGLLAYQVEDGEVKFGRTAICDGYLFLYGKSHSARIDGVYRAVSFGSNRKLGYFSLQRIAR